MIAFTDLLIILVSVGAVCGLGFWKLSKWERK